MSQFEEDGYSLAVEGICHQMRIAIRQQKKERHLAAQEAHRRWEHHPRTRLAAKLRRLANRLDLPEPELRQLP